AVAAVLTTCVAETVYTGLGGGGFATYFEAATGAVTCLDFFVSVPGTDGDRTAGPMIAVDVFFGGVPQVYSIGGASVAVPGVPVGCGEVHRRWGRLPWADLVAPAIRWADEGHPVSSFEYEVNTWCGEFTTYFPSGRHFYLPDGRWVPVGERFAYPEMARTLEQVAEHGPDWMISGGWAQEFVKVANGMGWDISLEHFEQAPPPRWQPAHRFDLGEYQVASLSPPQLQGVFLQVVLGVLRELDIASVEPMTAEFLYLVSAALAVGQAQFGYVNDPTVFDLALDVFADPDWQRAQAKLIRSRLPKRDLSDHARFSEAGDDGGLMGLVKAGVASKSSHADQPSGSCELSIVDADGNWIQMMNTLQSGGIPGVVIGGIPMVGSHATLGTHGSAIDSFLGEGIRMRSTIGNTMVFADGAPVFQLGTPGNVHCTVPQVLSYWHNHGLDPYEAASMPRVLPLSANGTVTVEDRVPDAEQEALGRLGLKLRALPYWDYHMGSFQMCYRDRETGELCATADPRRCGVAGGIPA
ncbi:MAG TPA: gamma-glutamyltransferase, partial [Nitriliruptorales bacterium]